MLRAFNKGRGANPIHHHLSPPSGGTLPPFSGLATITPSYVGGTTGLWNFALVLEDSIGNPLPSSGTITIWLKDVTNAVDLASATYHIDDVIGVATPISESNWTSLVVPHLTGTALSDGATFGFALWDWLLDGGDLFNNLVRNLCFSISVTNGSQPSPIDDAAFNYSFVAIGYDTTKNGTHQNTLGLNATDYVLIDWGDGQTAIRQIITPSTNTTVSFANTSSKHVQIAIPSTRQLKRFNMFAQAITSMDNFNTSNIDTFRIQGNPALSVLPNYDLGSCTYLDFRDNAFVSINSAFDVSNVLTLRLGGNDLTSLPSGWDLASCVTMEFNDNALTSLPALWDTGSLVNLDVGNNNISSLPAAWDVVDLDVLRVDNNPTLSSIPTGWLTTQIIELYIGNCAFTAIPAFNYASCTIFESFNNPITTIGVSHNFASIQIFQISNGSVATWLRTSVPNSLINLNLSVNLLPTTPTGVNEIIGHLYTSYLALNRPIIANLTGNGPPTGAAITRKNIMNAGGCTITTA